MAESMNAVIEPRVINTEKQRIDHEAFVGWKTILFNDNDHGFGEVERQLCKAIRCSVERAHQLTFQAHTSGSAVVYTGCRERCEAVSVVLERIRLRTLVTR